MQAKKNSCSKRKKIGWRAKLAELQKNWKMNNKLKE
jgi:hypothetical protein